MPLEGSMTLSGWGRRPTVGLLLFFVAILGAVAGAAAGFSRVIAAGGLSPRRPWNTAWRTRPSFVHSANETSATRFGLTKWAPFGALPSNAAVLVARPSSSTL